MNTSSACEFNTLDRANALSALFIILTFNALAAQALDFNFGGVKEEFEKKLSSQSILSTTKYYARGYSLHSFETLDENRLYSEFKRLNYRERDANQVLMPYDYVKLDTQQCEAALDKITHTHLSADQNCIMWRTSANESFLIQLDHDKNIIATFSGDPLTATNSAAVEPFLMAQFRQNEPLMQEELRLSKYPVACLNAVIAIEDNDFLDHSGVSYSGLARALVKNVISLRKAQGGSTITQQLVKNYFLTPEKTYTRKLKELYMATRLESQWSKDQILETYLNVIYMGQNGAYQVRGFGSASQYYFNKSIEQLELHECALLAAIINNPGMNNPWKKPDHAKNRRNLVLTKMKELKLISDREWTTAQQAQLPLENPIKASETAPYFFEAVRKQAEEMNLPTQGVSFYTSLDLTHQQLAQKSLQEGINELTIKKSGLSKIKEKGLSLQGSIISAENATGLVTAFVGGQNFRESQFNRALNARRPIGSLIKPFVYLTALINGFPEEKTVTPLTPLQDQPFTWKYEKQEWSPENYDRKFRGQIPFFYALKESLNSPTAQVAQKVGLGAIINTCERAGFKNQIPQLPSISLGTTEHTAVEVMQAYLTLANIGEYKQISFIEKILDEDQKTIYLHQITSERKFDVTPTSVLLGMMKNTLKNGTAKATQNLGFKKQAAGKTGTTSNGKDAWFVGFTPATTSLVWLGFDQNIATSLSGGAAAVPIWTQFMLQRTQNEIDRDFTWPETVNSKDVESGIEKDKNTYTLIFTK